MNRLRTLPLRLAPLSGEGLDSWLDALMHRLDITRRDIASALGMGPPQGKTPPNWTVILDGAAADVLSHATGVDRSVLAAMTMRRFDGIALKLNHKRREVVRSQLWGRGTGSRYCPQCLADGGGRWPLAWRLSWSFSCVKHLCLLVDLCPRCQGPPQIRRHWMRIPKPGRCEQPTSPDRRGRTLTRCGHELADTATIHLGADHLALAAQRRVDDAINSGTAAFGTYAADPVPAIAMFTDLAALAARVIKDVPSEHLRQFLPAGLVTHYEQARGMPLDRYRPDRADSRPAAMAPGNATIAATALTTAMQVLNSPTIDTAATVLRHLFVDSGARGFVSHHPRLASWENRTSPTLTAVYLSTVGRWLAPSDQLRYRIPAARPRRPAKGPTRAHLVPAMLWPWWSLRLANPAMSPFRPDRAALACALVTVGSTTSLPDSVAALGHPTDPGYVKRTLNDLNRDPAWSAIACALVRLADHLDNDGVPIDYRRRRQLDYRGLLPTDEWRQACQRADALPGLDVRARAARCFLFERISSLPAELAPPGYAVTDPAERTALVEFPIHLTPNLLTHLDNAGHEFLTRAGVPDEPVTWQPPANLATGLDLPGHDPDRVDMQALHELIRGQKRISLTRTAELLDTSIDVVRYALETNPAVPAWFPLTPAQARRKSLTIPRTTIGPDELAHLYRERQLSLSEIARQKRLPRQHVTLLAREYGIQLRSHNARRFTLDRDRLHEQYVVQRRSLHDIAVEHGVADLTVLHWLTVYRIPRRSRGGAGHEQAIQIRRDRGTVPAKLRPAMTGTRAWKRLHAFATLAQHPNYDAAATALGCHRTTLRDYVLRLEEELGTALIDRAQATRPLRLTKAGRNLLRAIEAADTQRRQGAQARRAAPRP
jgi:hypothetical protein